MRKATMDAFLLTLLTVICLTYLAIPVTHPLLFVLVILLVFALVYVIAVVIRLRKAARETGTPGDPYNYLFH